MKTNVLIYMFLANSNAISESNLQELNVKNPQQPGL